MVEKEFIHSLIVPDNSMYPIYRSQELVHYIAKPLDNHIDMREREYVVEMPDNSLAIRRITAREDGNYVLTSLSPKTPNLVLHKKPWVAPILERRNLSRAPLKTKGES